MHALLQSVMNTQGSSADSSTPSSGPHADHSCLACRKLKRKCSKDVPTCSLCSRVGRECEYPSSTSSPERRSVDASPAPSKSNSRWQTPRNLFTSRNHLFPAFATPTQAHDIRLAPPADFDGIAKPKRQKFQSAWYVDSVTARGMDIGPTTDLAWSEIEGVRLALTIDDARQIAQHYFGTVHEWLPISE